MDRLLALDATLTQRFVIPLESSWWQLARLTAHLGDGPLVFGGLGIFYLMGWLWEDAYLRQAILSISLIVLATMLVVTLIKFVVRRKRPAPPGEFVTYQYDAYSFPSGHSARMAALAAGIAFFFPALGWIAMVAALSVALARIAVGVHYVGDIVVGLVIGVVVAWGGLVCLQSFWPIPTS